MWEEGVRIYGTLGVHNNFPKLKGSILLSVFILSTKFKNMLNVSLIEEAPSSGDQGPLKGVNTCGPCGNWGLASSSLDSRLSENHEKEFKSYSN